MADRGALIDLIPATPSAFMLVSVVAAYGSVPRGPGAVMCVMPEGLTGTIGGGALEYQAIQLARDALAEGGDPFLRDFALGPKLDQCCGGRVTLLFDPFDAGDRPLLDAMARDPRALLRTHLGHSAGQPHHRLIAGSQRPDGLAADRAVALYDGAGRCFEPSMPVPVDDIASVIQNCGSPYAPLYIFGAGHVGRAVAAVLAPLPFDVHWIDQRADAFPADAPPHIRQHLVPDPKALVASAPAGALYLIFTHSHPLDFEITAAVLARGDSRYCGLIGSETKRARFIKRFRDEEHLDEARIGRLTCPIGLDGPPGKEPEVIAIAVAAELLHIVRGADLPMEGRAGL
ncbi:MULTISPECIES: xanthine dehydrogenase accessory protein XdhC [unclassified Iodidimonas]|uniref:xanthine dehydrogenase accessory protein XdhC n=1 Tax=unclassified Iodidimonas TaxID=2626145 RepID=UPI0024823558|nr:MULTISPECIES: xanthine dehydrogenase accessory protein XdhC [unclassified Iodidimonas]